ncbi:5-formyltetrahydrofolate cyclo-ligase [uncultured Sphingomonas sp.]|uniref:5-formyltetrahydrofolate cyclo-ligase n=1 Tax=uncultured Sphingomonas sp. TaxID=158754 RepID=UPI0035CC8869
MTDKHTLRVQLRARRAVATRTTLPVPAAFRARLSPGLTVASYVPIRGEADPSPLVRAAVEAGCAILLPHVVDRAIPMRFLAWDTEATLVAGPFGLHQPASDATEHVPGIILTPLVGFDRRGNRLGQGAGYYDRAFAAYPKAWRVGIAMAVQEIDALAIDAWDRPLHAVATEREWIMFEGSPS